MNKEIFARSELLLGAEALAVLATSHGIVCGLGGVGSYAAEALARSGLGHLTLIDFDNVNFSNINRQIPALLSTVGQSKCQIMAARIADINPDCHLEYKIVCLDEENISEIVGQGDFLLDAIDSLGAKAALIKYCLDNEIEVFSSMGTGNKLAPEMLQVADISQTKICPLARSLRRRLRSLGIEKGFQVVYSEEIPIVPKRDSENERAVGSCIFVPATAGLLLASLAIRQLVQKNSL